MKGNILIKNMTFKYSSMLEPLFSDVNLSIHEDWKLGLVGRNGRGKTTFFKILLDELKYEGSVQTSLEFKYFPSYPTSKCLTTLEILLRRNPVVQEWEIEREITLMGLSPDLLKKKFNVLSGGEQTKVLLAELFLIDNSFPLIDEPTNNLDLKGRNIVGNYLNNKKGFIVISHDESFLNHFVNYTLAINKASIDLIKGDVETWKFEKANADQIAKEKNAKLKSEINRLDETSRQVGIWGTRKENSSKDATIRKVAAKHMKRSKAIKKRTESMIEEKKNLIDNVEEIEELEIKIGKPDKQVLFFRNFSILRDGAPLFKPINADVYPGDQFFIEGENGIGKSTLLRYILGKENLETIGESKINLPENVSVLKQKKKDGNVNYSNLINKLTNVKKEEYLHLLHKMGVERSKFDKLSIASVSSGERQKLLLAYSLLKENRLLVWDEVTNNLDIIVINQLISSIQKYKPTIVAVDHDDFFVNSLASKRIKLKTIGQ